MPNGDVTICDITHASGRTSKITAIHSRDRDNEENNTVYLIGEFEVKYVELNRPTEPAPVTARQFIVYRDGASPNLRKPLSIAVLKNGDLITYGFDGDLEAVVKYFYFGVVHKNWATLLTVC